MWAVMCSVEFWILAVDHDLALTSDVRGKVFMADSQGTRVAVWEEISLDQGIIYLFDGGVRLRGLKSSTEDYCVSRIS